MVGMFVRLTRHCVVLVTSGGKVVQRLTEQYQPGDLVEIRFADDSESGWQLARVLWPNHPGLWVMTVDGQQWYVTNSRRIRRRPGSQSDPR